MPYSIAAAVIAAGGSYMAAKEGNKGKSTKEPSYLTHAENTAIDKATTIADRPYTPYTGDRVAGITQNEADATNLAGVNSDPNVAARRNLGAAEDMTTRVANNDFSGENINRYMNPYIKSALDPAARELKGNYADQLANLRATSASRGAFGGDRQTMLESNLRSNYGRNVGDLYSKGYAQAFDNAMQGWKSDNARMQGAADSYRAVGGDISRLNTSQISDLMRTGQSDRLLNQMQLDVNYGNFIEQRDWDVNNLEPLLKSITASKGGNITTTGGSGSGVAAALGAASTLIGYYGSQSKGANNGSGMNTAAQIKTDYANQNSSAVNNYAANLAAPTVSIED